MYFIDLHVERDSKSFHVPANAESGAFAFFEESVDMLSMREETSESRTNSTPALLLLGSTRAVCGDKR